MLKKVFKVLIISIILLANLQNIYAGTQLVNFVGESGGVLYVDLLKNKEIKTASLSLLNAAGTVLSKKDFSPDGTCSVLINKASTKKIVVEALLNDGSVFDQELTISISATGKVLSPIALTKTAILKDGQMTIQLSKSFENERLFIVNLYNKASQVSKSYLIDKNAIPKDVSWEGSIITITNAPKDIRSAELLFIHSTGASSAGTIQVVVETKEEETKAPTSQNTANETVNKQPEQQTPVQQPQYVLSNDKVIKKRSVQGINVVYDFYENDLTKVEIFYLDDNKNTLYSETKNLSGATQMILQNEKKASSIKFRFYKGNKLIEYTDNITSNTVGQNTNLNGQEVVVDSPFYYNSSYPKVTQVKQLNIKIPINCNSDTLSDIYVNNKLVYSKIDAISINELAIPVDIGVNHIRFSGYDSVGHKEEIMFQVEAQNPYEAPSIDITIKDGEIVKNTDGIGIEEIDDDSKISLIFERDYIKNPVYNYEKINVKGKVYNATKLMINNTEITTDKSGQFNIALQLKEGINNFKFTALNEKQNYEEKWTIQYVPIENAINVSDIKKEERPTKLIPDDYVETKKEEESADDFYMDDFETDGIPIENDEALIIEEDRNPIFLAIAILCVSVSIGLTFIIHNPDIISSVKLKLKKNKKDKNKSQE